jgi:adenosine kinase
MPKVNAARKRIVIITQGDKPVVFSNGEVVKEYPIRKLKHEEIVDTNGAGDAFVG